MGGLSRMISSVLMEMSLMLRLWHCLLIFANYWKVTKNFVRKKIASLLLNFHFFQVVIEYLGAFPLRAGAVKFHSLGQ